MKYEKHAPILWLTFSVILISVLLLTWPSVPSYAGPDLPPRPTATPTPLRGDDGKLVTSSIALQVVSPPTEAWTLVQWVDGLGDWHDVQGWQGTLDISADGTGTKRWWFPSYLFGKGPFRWVVYESPGGPVWGVSESFLLPAAPNDTLHLRVPVEDEDQ